jgi:hypothetical protein
MKTLTLTDDLRKAAQQSVWFEPPEQAIKNIPRFVAYVFTYGTCEATRALQQQLSKAELTECLDNAPAGIYDKRSWAYWQLVIADRFETPPMPVRTL